MVIFFTIYILQNITIEEYIFWRICLRNAGWKDANIKNSVYFNVILENRTYINNSSRLKYICDGIDQVVESYVDKTTEVVNSFNF